MNEGNSIKTIDRTSFTNQTKFRWNEISKIEDYFNQEIKERKLSTKTLSKYVAAFDYLEQILTALSATSDGISTFSLTSITGVPVEISSASFTLVFFFKYMDN